ncbi:MAG TPA: MBL fold metallo-hydrolase, partial [Bacillota bacterium]|nr:MBL fold metallo-hydrolase [Bacillota bacterium]
MNVTILGCSGGYPGPGQATSGYLVTIGDKHILIDCGSGVFSNLQQYVDINKVDAILITHFHADHFSDMMVMRYAIDMNARQGMQFATIPVFAPSTPENSAQMINEHPNFQVGYLHNESILPLFGAMATFFSTNHPVECYGVRIEHEGKVFVYSSDTNADTRFAGFMDDADLAILDCGELEAKRKPNMLHMTPKECFACA